MKNPSVLTPEPTPTGDSGDSFRGFEQAFKAAQDQHQHDLKAEMSKLRQKQVKAMIEGAITDAAWDAMVGQARKAAEHGEKAFLLLRFPSELCSDDSRAINNPPDPNWPETLRGEAAEVYARWDSTLRSHGFGLSAQVLNFPGGKPGDIGLFLQWGEQG